MFSKERCIVSTVKHVGGSVMNWGCFDYKDIGDIMKIKGIMKKKRYRNILENNAVPSGLTILAPNFVFQQENNPKHTKAIYNSYKQTDMSK